MLAFFPHFHAATPPGLTALTPYAFAAQISQATTCFARSHLARLQQVQHDLVVRHQQQRGLVDDRDVVQLFVRVLGREDRDGGFVHRRPAHAGVQITGREGRGRHAAEAAAALRRVNELPRGALVFGDEAAGEVERAAGDVRVDVDAAGKHDHAASRRSCGRRRRWRRCGPSSMQRSLTTPSMPFAGS